jgi:5'-nucleotidase
MRQPEKPHILVSNDDGITAPGLRALVESLREIARVSVVAPNSERSAAAQSLTLRQPIYYERVAEDEWAVEGTPADAMILAFNSLLKQRPALVVSGINRGGNLGENVYYSGTVGAAMEAAVNGVPAFAMSLAHRGKDHEYRATAGLAQRLAPMILKEKLPHGVLLNVNVPQRWTGEVRITRQSGKITRNVLKPGTDPRGREYFWLHEQPLIQEVEADTDYAAIFAGAAAITPLVLDHTHMPSLRHLAEWAAELTSAKRD